MPTVTSKKDPTNQALTRRRALADGRRRLRRITRRIGQLVSNVPAEKITQDVFVNDTTTLWFYDDAALEQLPQQIIDTVNDELETNGDTPPPGWWFSDYDEQSWRSGVMSENNNIEQMIAAAALLAVVFPIEQLIASAFYRRGLSVEVDSSYSVIRSLSSSVASSVTQEVINGIKGGLSPTVIRRNVQDIINRADSRLRRIVDTELNRANNDARTALAQFYRDELGIETAVLHVSALLPTTRPHHAARHGMIFTPEQQTNWWNQGANRINCHCSIRTILIDEDGKPLEQQFIDKISKERAFFEPQG